MPGAMKYVIICDVCRGVVSMCLGGLCVWGDYTCRGVVTHVGVWLRV